MWGKTDLSGLNTVLAIYTPGTMSRGNWTVAPYIDERASAAQKDALEQIITRSRRRQPEPLRSLIAKRRPAKSVPINFQSQGNVRKLSIRGIAEVTVEAITGAGNETVWIDNVGHFASRRLVAAKGMASHFKDDGLNFDNTGRNGHFAPIKWSNA